MALTDTRRPTAPTFARRHDFGYSAFWVLRIALGALPIVVGIDKYFDNFVDWKQYLWVGVTNDLHISATTFMHIAGGVEILAGVLVLLTPQLGGTLVAAWLAGIVTNLILVGVDEHEYWDIAIRDIGLFFAAVALVLLATDYRPLIGAGVRRARPRAS